MARDQLEGGITNAGAVIRDGDHVLRPSGPHSAATHALLFAVRRAGFDGAPFPIGIDGGQERLTFLPGDVPHTPYPEWCRNDGALSSVARLLRRFHDATVGFDHRTFEWSAALADPNGSSAAADIVMCHNDVEPANVVFRHGIAAALIDFEFAAPGRRIYDLAQLARLWVPIDDDIDRDRVGWNGLDPIVRLRLLADSYGLDAAGRSELVGAIDDAVDTVETASRRSVRNDNPAAVALWNRTGGGRRFDRRRRWWAEHRERCAAGLE